MNFVISKIETGKLNAAVKNLMVQMHTSDPNEAVRRINSHEWVATEVENVIKTGSHLSAPTTTSLPAIKRPQRLQDMEYVCLRNKTKWQLGDIQILSAQEERTVTYCDIIKNLTEFQLVDELGGEEVVYRSVEALETVLSQYIAKQSNGEPGALINNGHPNMFYVYDPEDTSKVLYIFVYWEFKKWLVDSSGVYGCDCSAGSRAFKAAVAFQSF